MRKLASMSDFNIKENENVRLFTIDANRRRYRITLSDLGTVHDNHAIFVSVSSSGLSGYYVWDSVGDDLVQFLKRTTSEYVAEKLFSDVEVLDIAAMKEDVLKNLPPKEQFENDAAYHELLNDIDEAFDDSCAYRSLDEFELDYSLLRKLDKLEVHLNVSKKPSYEVELFIDHVWKRFTDSL